MEDQSQAVSTPAIDNASTEPKTLAQALRVKFPGKYDNLSDTELEQATIAVHPEYASWPRTQVSSQEAIGAMHKVNQATGLEGAVEKPVDLGDALKRVAGGVVSEANPIDMAKGIYQTLRHPIDTAVGIGEASLEHAGKAVNAAKQGRWTQMIGEAGSSFPVVGPAAANIGEELARTGDVPRAIGRGVTLAATTAGPELAKMGGGVVKAAGSTSLGTSAADALAEAGGAKVAKAMTPIRGEGAVKFADMANQIGEGVATDPKLKGSTLIGLQNSGQTEMAKVAAQMDAASAARLKNSPIDVPPLIAALEKAKGETQVEPFNAAQIGGQNSLAGQAGQPVPYGTTQKLQSPFAQARAQQIQSAIDTLKGLGPQTNFDNLLKIRQDFDKVALPGGYITKPADVLTAGTNKGMARGAMDVTGTIREALAAADPETAKLNPRYSMLRKLDDVIDAVNMSEQTRPTTGRNIATAGVGMMTAGTLGAIVAPMIDLAVRSGPAAELVMGRAMGQMATMLRAGDMAGAAGILTKLRRAAGMEAAGNQARPMAVSGVDVTKGIQ